MTIATEISKLQENLANAYSTIEEKGATLPSAQNFDNLATTISSIPSATSYTAGTGIDITNDVISVTSDISTGASLGASAVQPSALNEKADIDLSNLNSQGKNIANWSTNVTNCITEIPQDIKLEFTGSNMILKAGSKVTFGDGTSITINVDKNIPFNITSADKYVVCYTKYSNSLTYNRLGSQTASGTTTPTSGYWMYYNTTDKKVYDINNGVNAGELSLPLCIFSSDTSSITSIDQVFNGFGYIGSTVFALPGVKGLIPNGRNTDGILKNIECSFSKVVTQTNTVQYSGNIALKTDTLDLALGDYYDEETNYNRLSDGRIFYRCIAGKFVKGANGVITSFTPKTAFRAVDYNDAVKYSDKSAVIGWGMPDYSARISISSPYTVPKNGIVCVRATSATSYFPVLRINGVDIFTPNSLGLGWALASKGDVASLDNENNAANFYYIPFKGEN